jgi:two-component system, NarL family, nitrate/nitrite response regulator NarL
MSGSRRTQAGSSGRRGPIRVILADEHPLYRDALGRAIRQDAALELVHAAIHAADLASAIARFRPDVALVDAAALGAAPLENGCATRVLVLATEVDAAAAYAAVEAGAAGYISKDAEADVICRAVVAVARGETVLDPRVQSGIAGEIRLRVGDERPALTPREHEILVLTADGLSGPEIARALGISPATVKTHQQRLYEKLRVGERAAAVARAMRWGLIE